MNPIQSVQQCFRKYFDFSGRAMRSEFWWFQLFVICLTIGATLLDGLLFGYGWKSTVTSLALTADVLTILPMAAVTARRLHDIGMSGWWQLPIFATYTFYIDAFIPGFAKSAFSGALLIVVGIYSLWLLFKFIKDSDPYTNQYGPNPKGEDVVDVFT